MAKIGRNEPCPCGSEKKFKKCCWLKPRDSTISPPIRVVREVAGSGEGTFRIELNTSGPYDVYFDTNVWRSMNSTDMEVLEKLKTQHGFRYRYSITNYAELMSHLGEAPSKKWPNPFAIVKASFQRILELCESEVLQAPSESGRSILREHPQRAALLAQIGCLNIGLDKRLLQIRHAGGALLRALAHGLDKLVVELLLPTFQRDRGIDMSQLELLRFVF